MKIATTLSLCACCLWPPIQGPPETRLFNGKDLSGWRLKGSPERSRWKVGAASLDPENPSALIVEEGDHLVNAPGGGVDLYTEASFGDGIYELEIMVPRGSNSGVYLLGEYEVQILDSHGKKQVGLGDMGAVYGVSPPKLNAARPPGEWQRLRIDFRGPRFDGSGKKIAHARFVKVVLNGQVIQEDVEARGPTRSGLTGRESPQGPLLLQGTHGPVAFRAIQVAPIR